MTFRLREFRLREYRLSGAFCFCSDDPSFLIFRFSERCDTRMHMVVMCLFFLYADMQVHTWRRENTRCARWLYHFHKTSCCIVRIYWYIVLRCITSSSWNACITVHPTRQNLTILKTSQDALHCWWWWWEGHGAFGLLVEVDLAYSKIDGGTYQVYPVYFVVYRWYDKGVFVMYPGKRVTAVCSLCILVNEIFLYF